MVIVEVATEANMIFPFRVINSGDPAGKSHQDT
jgi:hypothetical protein